VTDELFRQPSYRVVDQRGATRPVYAYQFEVVSPLLGGALGATHSIELPFVFANVDRWGPAPFVQGLAPDVVDRVGGALHPA
jgi:para-nitrobenzyl esterase